MKRFCRILALLLAAALLLAGCGESTGLPNGKKGNLLSKPVTAASLLETMARQVWGQKSAEFTLQAAVDMAADTGNGMSDIQADANIEGEFLSSIQLHISADANLNMMGMAMGLPVEAYVFREEDAMTVCYGVMGQWTTQSIPLGSFDLDQVLSSVPDFSIGEDDEEFLSHVVLQDEKELIEDKECYRLDLVLTPEELNQVAEGIYDGVASATGRGVTDEEGSVDVGVSLWIDAKTVLPTRLSVSFVGPMETEQFILRSFALQLDFLGFNTVESIEIPEEILTHNPV